MPKGNNMKPINRERQLPLRVLRRVEQHTKNDPILGAALAEELGVSWRTVAACVEELRDAGFKVGSSNQSPMGYFMARDSYQMLETVDRLRSQAKKILARTNRMMDFQSQQPTVFEGAIDAG